MRECDFCDEFSGGRRNAFANRYGTQLAERVMLAHGSFRLVPSVGQIAEGHLLMIPVEHSRALADLPNEQLRELEELRQRVRSVLRDVYGVCVFFEHGIRGVRSGGCGIDHAHMHAVPVAAEGLLDALTKEFGGHSVRSFADVRNEVCGNSSYLFFEDASAQRLVFPVDNLPSQYMRRLVAESMGESNWDWRECGEEPALVSTLRRLPPLLRAGIAAPRG